MRAPVCSLFPILLMVAAIPSPAATPASDAEAVAEKTAHRPSGRASGRVKNTVHDAQAVSRGCAVEVVA